MIGKIIREWMLPQGCVTASEDRAKILWLTHMRWVAIAAQLLSLWLGLRLGIVRGRDAPLFGGIIAGAICFNRWVLRSSPQGQFVLLTHLLLDLSCLASLLSLSGGCNNPMVALIFLHAALGPMLLSGVQNIVYLLATCVSLGIICFATPIHDVSHLGPEFHRLLRLGSELLVVCAIWGITTWLVATLAWLRAALTGAQRKQQRSDHLRALGAMASGFSHEFATPLNTAKMRLERALRIASGSEAGPAEFTAELTAAITAVDQCEGVLRSLFGMQLDAGSVRFSEFDLTTFVERICARWQNDRGGMNVRITSDSGGVGVRCVAPQIALSKTLLDLLDNAAEATQTTESGKDAVIEVTLASSQGNVEIAISDRGCGFPETLKDRIGEPFSTTRPGGAGLGLYTAYGLMDALGGWLEILPRFGGGTTVRLLFPANSPHV